MVMKMYRDLFGDLRKEPIDYAKKIVSKGISKPFYKIKARVNRNGVNLRFVDDKLNLVRLTYPGYYAIYRKVKGELECLYVGRTDHHIYSRVHRWAKGVCGKLRDDEIHTGGTLARNHGVNLKDELLVKCIEMQEAMELIDDDRYQTWPLDEWIAPILKSKFNTNERYM